MKKILIAPNSFKECSSSVNVSNLFEKYLSRNTELELISIPISDGGDGFLEVCKSKFQLTSLSFEIKRVYSDDIFTSEVGISPDKKTVYIESAKILGLQGIPLNERKPLILNSSNLGELLMRVIEKHKEIEKVVIGVGGTGTNDLGLGICSVFGFKAFDRDGVELPIIPQNYQDIKDINWNKPNLNFEIELIIDVDNPLLGEYAAIKTFAGQKGASTVDIKTFEQGFANVLNVIKNNDLLTLPHNLSGAGGGLAAGLQIFFNARTITSKEFITKYLFGEQPEFNPDFIITGEGNFDDQSLQNKGPKVVIDRFKDAGIPVFLVCGKIDPNSLKRVESNIIPIELIKYFKTEKESINKFDKGIKLACDEILKNLAN